MLKIEYTRIYGWGAAIRGARNSFNSWSKSDSFSGGDWDKDEVFALGSNDNNLMLSLRKAGSDHAKYSRMIIITCDIIAPLYWWKEFDTYKVGTVSSSCSTMHTITKKEFTMDDFSHDHLNVNGECILRRLIDDLNDWRNLYINYDRLTAQEKCRIDPAVREKKDVWWQIIQLLPSSYNQRRTILFDYEVLANIYASRKNHKLDEWHTFCEWIKTLPYSELITLEES